MSAPLKIRHFRGVNFALGLPSSKLPTFSAGGNPAVLSNMPFGLVPPRCGENFFNDWIPACAGMTEWGNHE